MELASIIGLVSGLFFIISSILLAAHFNIPLAFHSFFNASSIMIVFGGTLAATLISAPLPKLISAMKASTKILKTPDNDPVNAIENIINLANIARKEGILALEETARNMDDKFLQKGVMLIVDGTDPELVRNILDTELAYIETRHAEIRGIWDTIGAMAPAWGMIGTLIGLVMMLQDLSDPDSIGPSMAVALITTFYGSVIANYIAIPIANKLKVFSAEEILIKEVLIEGMLSVQAGENPRIIEEKLKAFLSPELHSSDSKEGEE